MDSPFTRGPLESPYLRAQEAKYGQNSSFSLGPAMNDNSGGFDASPSADSPQGTAELTAFVQNLLQQMQTRFQSMSDAIIVKIDGMASRIDELERAVDEVLREVTGEEPLPTPSSPMLRGLGAAGAPGSPDRRKFSIGGAPGQSSYYPTGGQGSYYPSSPGRIGRYPSTGALMSPKTTPLTGGYQSGSGAFGVSPDPRRHSATSAMPAASPRSSTLPGSFETNSSPGVRRALSSSYGSSESQENRQ